MRQTSGAGMGKLPLILFRFAEKGNNDDAHRVSFVNIAAGNTGLFSVTPADYDISE